MKNPYTGLVLGWLLVSSGVFAQQAVVPVPAPASPPSPQALFEELHRLDKALQEKRVQLERARALRDAAEARRRTTEKELLTMKWEVSHQPGLSDTEKQRLGKVMADKERVLGELAQTLQQSAAHVESLQMTVELERQEQARREAMLLGLIDKRRGLRVFVGTGVNYLGTPGPRGSDVLVFWDAKGAAWEVDAVTSLAFVLWDSGREDYEQTWAFGPHVGLGARAPFRSFYAGAFLKVKHLYVHGGFNLRGHDGGPGLPVLFSPYVGLALDVSVFGETAGLLPRR
jgi:uncharacterized protein (DUF2384 family)